MQKAAPSPQLYALGSPLPDTANTALSSMNRVVIWDTMF